MNHGLSTTPTTCTTRRREASYTTSHLRVMRQCATLSRTRENGPGYTAASYTTQVKGSASAGRTSSTGCQTP